MKTNIYVVGKTDKKTEKRKKISKTWIILILISLISPLGLVSQGTAWGEWGREELQNLGLGFIPSGFEKYAEFWSAPIPDYDLPLFGNPIVSYIFSALFSMIIIYILMKIILSVSKVLLKNN